MASTLPTLSKPSSGEVFVDGNFILFIAKTKVESITPTSGTITPAESNVVLGSEMIYDSTGAKLVEGTGYESTKDTDNPGCVTAWTGLGEGAHVVTYTYVTRAFGGATGLSMGEDHEQGELPLGCSHSKIVIGKGSSKKFSFKDISYVGDLETTAALSGTYEEGATYKRHTSGAAKDLSIVAFLYDEEADLVYTKEMPRRAFIIENGKVKTSNTDASEAQKSFDVTSSKHRTVDYVVAG